MLKVSRFILDIINCGRNFSRTDEAASVGFEENVFKKQRYYPLSAEFF